MGKNHKLAEESERYCAKSEKDMKEKIVSLNRVYKKWFLSWLGI